MNTDRTAPKEEADQGDTLGNEARSVVSGNAAVDGATHRGWFLGHFLENACGLRATSAVEVKWGAYSAGEERSSWGMSERATSLCVLFRGRIQFRFPQEEYLLACEGDYLIWSVGLPHHWKVLEDTCILTVRWPSIPGASQESRTISCDTIKGESLRSLAGS